jgi:hypothetical protein
MISPDREHLKRACADALEAPVREQRLTGLTPLSDALRALGPTYRSHGEQIQAAAWAREENVVTWHLIHVLEKLEQGVP